MSLLLQVILCLLMIRTNCFKFMHDWCKNNNLFIHPDIILNESEFGRGIFATNDIDSDVILMSIPMQCCLFEATIKTHLIEKLSTLNISHTEFNLFFSTSNDIPLALYLTQLKLLKQSAAVLLTQNHYFFPYLNQLPNSPNIPLFWKSNLIHLINHTQAYQSTITQYKHISNILSLLNRYNLSDKIKPFHNQLFWAFSMVSSRMWKIKINKPFVNSNNIDLNKYQTSFGEIPMFVPGADIFNHNPNKASVFIKYNATSETINVISNDEIDKNEQIFINYGRKCNSILLSQYGFIMQNNPYIYSQFDLYLIKDDVNFISKRQLLKQGGFTEVEFTKHGLDWKSAKAFYIASLSPKMFTSHVISKILSVPHNAYFKSKINELNHTQKNKEFWLNEIDNDEIKKISSKLKMFDATIEYRLRQSLCQRFSMLQYLLEIQTINAIEYKQSMCTDKLDKNHNFCGTLYIILTYLKLEINIFSSCKNLYCNDT